MFNFIIGLPKAELHVHLEGTIGTLAPKIAARNDIDYPFKTVEDVNLAFNKRTYGLESFLNMHYLLVNAIKTKQDFYELTFEFLRKCRENNVVYVEIKFDPQNHTDRGIRFNDIVEGIDKGRNDGFREFGVESNIIMCINRERTVDSAWEMLEQAYPYRHLISGLGLDSYEKDNPPSKFTEVYEAARDQGYMVTAHCDVDQENSVKHIWQCINLLKTSRIDHGVNCIEDPELVKELIKRGVTLNVCPTWRSPYTGPRDLERIRKMYDLGLKVTLNSDDPAEFNSGFMNKLLCGAVKGSGYTKTDLVKLMKNAFEGSWLPKEKKEKYINTLYNYARTKL
jgi:adenosine deaminase